MTTSVQELRKRAWDLANNSIRSINKINEILYEGMKKKPEVLKNIDNEEIDNFKVEYVKKLLDITTTNYENLKSRTKMIDYIFNKHNELKNKYIKL